MATLLLRLVGPMQSWGVQSRFGMRDTGREPSKSGLIGVLCAALGRPRDVPLDDLASLLMGVRVDREGILMMDFHTAQNVYKAGGGKPKDTELSRRYYLADAAFLAGFQGGSDLLGELHAALRAPHWPLYLGRKAFVPGAPVWLPDGLREGEDLESALRTYPWLGRGESPPDKLRVVLDDDDGDQVRPDVPLSFTERRFSSRRVATRFYGHPPTRKEVS